MRVKRSGAWLTALVAPPALVLSGCGPSPGFEPEAVVPEGAVVVPAAAAGGVACGLESTMRSRLGAETKYRITNATAERIQLYWLDYGGKRRSFGGLEPGQSQLKQSYAGHIWIATDAGGHCLAAGVATERMGELRVGAGPTAGDSSSKENDR